jgi:hypothetical protein
VVSGGPPASSSRLRCRPIGGGFAGALPLAEALALHDDLVGIVGEPIERALGEDRIVEERDPLVDRA